MFPALRLAVRLAWAAIALGMAACSLRPPNLAGAFANSIYFAGQHVEAPVGWQAGARLSEHVVVTADSYPVVVNDFHGNTTLVGFPNDNRRLRVWALSGAIGWASVPFNFNPTLLYIPKAELWSAGLSLTYKYIEAAKPGPRIRRQA